jgi:aspartyl-tRNA(Asn)/glutamyl-tRNA(Gln) amidotransferase subunit A
VTEILFSTIIEQSAAIDTGAIDPIELTRITLKRIEALNQTLNAFVVLGHNAALDDAAAANARMINKSRLGPLDGIPIALKDNIDIAGMPTGNGFADGDRLPAWRLPDTDAAVVQRLRRAGAVILGKLNMHEGALGATTDNPHTGKTMNPHRIGYTPGGSSGGAGAAVAASLCAGALGTDTGGSIRIPASYCGIVGFKPSYGAISTHGVAPLCWRLDHIGPVTRSVADARLLFDALRGYDPNCAGSRRIATRNPAPRDRSEARLGVWANFPAEPVEPEITAAFAAALGVFQRLGCELSETALSSFDNVRQRRAALLRIEVDAAIAYGDLLSRSPERISPALRAYLDYGAAAKAVSLAQADRVIEIAAHDLARAFDDVDAIVSPATPQSAFAFGAEVPNTQNAFSLLANFTGCPAISVPMGRNREGLPLGLQIMGPTGHDDFVLDLAATYEAAAGWQLRPPPPFGPG